MSFTMPEVRGTTLTCWAACTWPAYPYTELIGPTLAGAVCTITALARFVCARDCASVPCWFAMNVRPANAMASARRMVPAIINGLTRKKLGGGANIRLNLYRLRHVRQQGIERGG